MSGRNLFSPAIYRTERSEKKDNNEGSYRLTAEPPKEGACLGSINDSSRVDLGFSGLLMDLNTDALGQFLLNSTTCTTRFASGQAFRTFSDNYLFLFAFE